ncbi:CS1 type fimbrial major subunit [Yersinia aleksiciae]|uniref:CS1 type fimbrial major subunit n=2 Tax=Yersinia aleksiciae TaxID=263819 RepID=UPI00119FB28B|nr:CS1 type fimbrial major subunit [Yersinia aleksiciae]
MMKKTLLSIMTVAALISSASVYSAVSNKTIQVEAEIPGMITITKADDSDIGDIISLVPDTTNAGYYTHSEDIKISNNADGHPSVNISINDDFKLNHTVDVGKTFTDLSVKLDNRTLSDTKERFNIDDVNGSVALVITGKPPIGSTEGEKYQGVLKLTIESVA